MIARRPLGTVLVTGAAGFLGRAVVERLAAEGVEVVATDVHAAGSVLACDVTDAAAIEAALAGRGVATILHLGGVSGPMVMTDDPLAIFRINALGTAAVLDAARRHRVGRVVVTSSVDVYGATLGMVSEATPPAPVTVYGASKVAAEAAVLGYAGEHRVDALAIRLSWIYGPGRSTPTTLARLCMATGEAIEVPFAATDLSHYLALADAVDAVFLAATAGQPAARIVNITAGACVPFGTVVDLLRALRPDLRVAYAAPAASVPSSFDQTLAQTVLEFRARFTLADGLKLLLNGPA